jgi:hypothetical protein
MPNPKDDEFAQNEGIDVVQIIDCHQVIDVTLPGQGQKLGKG